MYYVIHCVDKEDHLPVRMENRPNHVAYLQSFGDKLYAAGPTFGDDGTMNGSVLILDFADRVAAEEFAANDPYAKAGLFAQVTINQWKKVLPA